MSGLSPPVITRDSVNLRFTIATDKELADARHQWELPESDKVVLHLDAAQKGVGNGSCGYKTGTLEKYSVPEEVHTIHFRITGIR